MHYERIRITNYRGIRGPLEVDLSKPALMPIIGVNECGKTTILHAILAFDHVNDESNDGRHLEDVTNLYETSAKNPEISARIKISKEEFKRSLGDVADEEEWEDSGSIRRYRQLLRKFPGEVEIIRALPSLEYRFADERFDDQKLNHDLAKSIIAYLPYIMYFDDFTGSVGEKIEISRPPSEWLSILGRLFRETDRTYSIYELPDKEPRVRKSILSKVRRKLDETLTQEWRNFRLDDTDGLTVSVEYVEDSTDEGRRAFLKFEIVETDAEGYEHFFFVRDRSKGFFWFFNFVMKLEFNPKAGWVEAGPGAIYLLDEPGSYLHAAAQDKLCAKLRSLSAENSVIYCTHSHYLLNPDHVALNSIRIAEKDGSGEISLLSIYEHKGRITEVRSAYQPVMDALQVRPFEMDLIQEPVLLVEGMVDYYLFTMFKPCDSIVVVPGVGAASMKFYISLLIAWRLDYRALWDNDPDGREGLKGAAQHFGDTEAEHRFHLLPLLTGRSRKTIAQSLVDGTDLKAFREAMTLPSNSSFDKVISSLFFADEREELLAKVSERTTKNFGKVFEELGFEPPANDQ